MPTVVILAPIAKWAFAYPKWQPLLEIALVTSVRSLLFLRHLKETPPLLFSSTARSTISSKHGLGCSSPKATPTFAKICPHASGQYKTFNSSLSIRARPEKIHQADDISYRELVTNKASQKVKMLKVPVDLINTEKR